MMHELLPIPILASSSSGPAQGHTVAAPEGGGGVQVCPWTAQSLS